MVPRENKNNAYEKFGDKRRVLWYFSKWPIVKKKNTNFLNSFFYDLCKSLPNIHFKTEFDRRFVLMSDPAPLGFGYGLYEDKES